MTDIELLPLPEARACTAGTRRDCWVADEMEAYTSANVAPLIAKIERLRVDNKTLEDHLVHAMSEVDRLGKQGERLAGALRDALEYLHHHLPDEALAPHRAVLRDHDQEVGND